jgi:hypothetical protein
MKYMNDTVDCCELNLSPKYGFCNDVRLENYPIKKIVWLVPHVIKHDTHEHIITWRCNWGNVCKSVCIYAMAKGKNENIIENQEILRKKDLTLTYPRKNDNRYHNKGDERLRIGTL